jgi:SAM-dependent methyltransferase
MTAPDNFDELAPFYDALMAEVRYERWLATLSALGGALAVREPRHLDAACGTGKLLRVLAESGWGCGTGTDLSGAMLRSARNAGTGGALIQADLRALPFRGAFDLVTCLFDSMNFLLTPEDVASAMRSIAGAMRPGGLFHFDLITERLVLEHFADQEWSEQHGKFRAVWSSLYDRETRISETVIKVGHRRGTRIQERVHPLAEVRESAVAAGLEVLAEVDAEKWKPPGHDALRIEIVCAKSSDDALRAGVADAVEALAAASG